MYMWGIFKADPSVVSFESPIVVHPPHMRYKHIPYNATTNRERASASFDLTHLVDFGEKLLLPQALPVDRISPLIRVRKYNMCVCMYMYIINMKLLLLLPQALPVGRISPLIRVCLSVKGIHKHTIHKQLCNTYYITKQTNKNRTRAW